MSKPDNPWAFPRQETEQYYGADGMTLRDWFAGQALAGMSANPGFCSIVGRQAVTDGGDPAQMIAQCAFEYADAMLAARTLNPGEAV